MQRIPPKQRYSKSETRDQFDPGLAKAAATELGFEPSKTPELLSGGYKNSNSLIVTPKGKFVLRESATDLETTSKEGRLLNEMNTCGVMTPRCLTVQTINDKVFAVHEFVEGRTLEDHLLSGEPASEELFFEIGSQCARIHNSHRFSTDGFLDDSLNIKTDMGNTDEFLPGYMTEVLSSVSEDRLPKPTVNRFFQLIESEWQQVRDSKMTNRLTHMDFNPKNLLVNKRGKLLAVLDWEFAMAANALADPGNFFRFSYDYPEFAKASFEAGYRSVSKDLPDNWDSVSRLLDLAAMCGFLSRQSNYSRSYHTARVVIEDTLDCFGF